MMDMEKMTHLIINAIKKFKEITEENNFYQ